MLAMGQHGQSGPASPLGAPGLHRSRAGALPRGHFDHAAPLGTRAPQWPLFGTHAVKGSSARAQRAALSRRAGLFKRRVAARAGVRSYATLAMLP